MGGIVAPVSKHSQRTVQNRQLLEAQVPEHAAAPGAANPLVLIEPQTGTKRGIPAAKLIGPL